MSKLVIGIDTGVNTGFAVWDCEEQCFLRVACLKIHQAMDLVLEFEPALVRVEDARIFKGGKFISAAKRQGAGSVKRDASIWEDFLTDKGILFELVSPLDKGKKLNANQFKIRTGWTQPTNEHGRDAGCLIHGFTNRNLLYYLQTLKG